MTNSPLATPDAWDLVSPGYLLDIVPSFERYADEALRLASLPEGARVVDVACGPGTLSLRAAPRAASVHALDFAERMVALCRERAAQRGAQNVEVVVGDGQALPYAEASFDAGFSMFGLIFFPDRHRGFSELLRVLRPGGCAVVSSWQPLDRVKALVAVFEALREALPDLPLNLGKAPLGDRDEFVQEMGAAGFTEVTIHEVTFSSDHESADALLDSYERSLAPLVLLRNRMGEEAFRPLMARIRERARRDLGEGPQRVTMPSWVGVGRKPG